MQKLIDQLTQKMGMSPEEARKAVLIMTAYLKDKLPPVLFADVDAIIEVPEASDEEKRALSEYRFP